MNFKRDTLFYVCYFDCTVPGLQRIANKLNIDCAAAITGFEYSTNGWSYPVKDGFVVCEEYKDILLDAFNQVRKRVLFLDVSSIVVVGCLPGM